MSLLIFKAMADDTRLRLINILLHYELSVNELVQILDMGQSRVSRHLKILAEAGLLTHRRDGLWIFYSAPANGSQRDFLNAVMPFVTKNGIMARDQDMAARVIEERVRKTRQFFNSIADNWDDLNHEILGDFDLAGRIVRAMPKGCAVAVDLGCGTGAILKSMQSRTARAIGVDGSARMLDLCKCRMLPEDMAKGNVSLRIGELNHLPLADHEANFACINLVLHHLARPEEIFAEIQRILSPGGTLFIADFIRHSDESMRSRYGDHWLGFDPEDMKSRLTAAGFEIISTDSHPVGKNLVLFIIVAKSCRG